VTVSRLEIERYKLMLAKARREQYGQSSERARHMIEQLELAIEDLEETPCRSGAHICEVYPWQTRATWSTGIIGYTMPAQPVLLYRRQLLSGLRGGWRTSSRKSLLCSPWIAAPQTCARLHINAFYLRNIALYVGCPLAMGTNVKHELLSIAKNVRRSSGLTTISTIVSSSRIADAVVGKSCFPGSEPLPCPHSTV
jgi:Transposase C of IS166 homeodomain